MNGKVEITVEDFLKLNEALKENQSIKKEINEYKMKLRGQVAQGINRIINVLDKGDLMEDRRMDSLRPEHYYNALIKTIDPEGKGILKVSQFVYEGKSFNMITIL